MIKCSNTQFFFNREYGPKLVCALDATEGCLKPSKDLEKLLLALYITGFKLTKRICYGDLRASE